MNLAEVLVGGLICAACAGADGTNGVDGENGRDGESPEISTGAASADDCPSGGTEIEIDGETIVLCNGDDGADGETGPAGEQGPAGADGEAAESIGRIAASIACNGAIEGTYSLTAYQQVAVFTDGSVWTSARITDGVLSASESAFYAPEQIGSGAAVVIVGFDVQGPSAGGFWIISFDVTTFESVVTYTDSDLVGGEQTWTLPGDSCVVNEY